MSNSSGSRFLARDRGAFTRGAGKPAIAAHRLFVSAEVVAAVVHHTLLIAIIRLSEYQPSATRWPWLPETSNTRRPDTAAMTPT